jgi:ribosomal protein L25 (general stress protein Ctc)
MAANAKLSAQPREDVGKGVARKLRAQGVFRRSSTGMARRRAS